MYTDGYADAIRPEQTEKAILIAVVSRLNRPHMHLQDCAEAGLRPIEREDVAMPPRGGPAGALTQQKRSRRRSKGARENRAAASPGRGTGRRPCSDLSGK